MIIVAGHKSSFKNDRVHRSVDCVRKTDIGRFSRFAADLGILFIIDPPGICKIYRSSRGVLFSLGALTLKVLDLAFRLVDTIEQPNSQRGMFGRQYPSVTDDKAFGLNADRIAKTKGGYMEVLLRRLSLIFISINLASVSLPVGATQVMPGKGIKVQPARATWNTGFFQEALVRRGLESLGYEVQAPKDLQVSIFYKAVAQGEVDYWANGWFPDHHQHLPKDFYDKAGTYGYIMKRGGLQGYLVSKREVDKFNIKSLDDFKRQDVKKAFDTSGDGKADLVACPRGGWACEHIIGHHLRVYDLLDHINRVKVAYEANMATALRAYRNGEPIFFYTWTPNWTIFMLKPGKDVMWINVPQIIPEERQIGEVGRMTVSGVDGAVTDPIKLGFVASDIRIVANNMFVDRNPAAKKFFQVLKLPLSDVNEQITRMMEGQKSQKDIERHADEWIEKNRSTWNGWLDAARKAAK